MTIGAVFSRRVRGFRLVELIGLAVLAAIILSVYLGKAVAGREEAAINRTERQIAAEQARVRLLDAEVAYFEQPARLEQLSIALHLAPIEAGQEITLDRLPAVTLASAGKAPASSSIQTAAAAVPPAGPPSSGIAATAPMSATPISTTAGPAEEEQ